MLWCSSWHCYLDVVLFVLFVATVPVYLLYMGTLMRHRRKRVNGAMSLTSAFFTLSFSVGLADIYYFFNSWLGMRRISWMMPLCLWGGRGLAKFLLIGAWVTRTAQGMGIFFMTVNRFSIIWFPAKTDYLWGGRKVMGGCLAIEWGMAAGMGALAWSADVDWQVDVGADNRTRFASPVFTDVDEKQRLFNTAAGIEALICPSVIVLYTLTVFKMIKHVVKPHVANIALPETKAKFQTKRVAPTPARAGAASQMAAAANASKSRRAERNLTLCGLIICSQEVIWVVFLALAMPRTNTEDFFALYALMGDIYAASNPWVLLAFSQAVHDALLDSVYALLLRVGASSEQVTAVKKVLSKSATVPTACMSMAGGQQTVAFRFEQAKSVVPRVG